MTKIYKVLNLYAGVGGNRKHWKNVKVTAVEIDPAIAKIYQDFFPDDEVIVGDAHEYLLNHFQEFDFIWISPPCQTHSRSRFWGSHRSDTKIIYPDMKLYQEIILLKKYCKKLWVIENVIPYYEPLIQGKKVSKHLFWSNFSISNINVKSINSERDLVGDLQKTLGINLDKYKIKGLDKTRTLRNCVMPELGFHILNCARNYTPPIQEGLFE